MVDKKIHKIRLQIQAFESKTLNDCCKEITMGMKQINSIIKGPIPMPTKKMNLLCFKISTCKQRFKRTF